MHTITPQPGVQLQPMLPFREARMRNAVQTAIKRTRRMEKPQEREAILIAFQQLELDLPLFDAAGTVFDATYEVVGPTVTTAAVSQEAVPDNFNDLKLEHIARMHAKLLYRQLEQLFYARDVGSEARREVLEWIYAPAERLHERADGTAKLIRAVHVPFTFDACCSYEEIDAEHLRDAIVRRIEELKGSRTLLNRPKELQ